MPGFKEFVALIAGLMAINALGIDIMLPALPAMGEALGIAVDNQRQYIITAYVVGFGSMQIIYGPLADRFGRRPVLFGSLGLFVAMSLLATFATSFGTIIAARLLQGMGAAASRVLAVSIVRDRYEGRRMARVMSLAFVVFLMVPILAPSIGQLILLVGPWPWIFHFLAAFGALLILWAALRLPETLNPADQRPIDPATLLDAARQVMGNRASLGYTLASTALFGMMMGFINSVQQIFADTFRRPDIFALAFAASASAMVVAALLNARIVERLGTRRVSHSALLALIALAAVHLALAASGHETVATFVLFQAATLFCFALAGSNFGAMSMEPLGRLAGSGSAVQGTVSTVGAAGIGVLIGQAYDGTTVPLAVGYVLCGLAALAIVFVTERGRLFRSHGVPAVQ